MIALILIFMTKAFRDQRSAGVDKKVKANIREAVNFRSQSFLV
jgi:hypothetical protein